VTFPQRSERARARCREREESEAHPVQNSGVSLARSSNDSERLEFSFWRQPGSAQRRTLSASSEAVAAADEARAAAPKDGEERRETASDPRRRRPGPGWPLLTWPPPPPAPRRGCPGHAGATDHPAHVAPQAPVSRGTRQTPAAPTEAPETSAPRAGSRESGASYFTACRAGHDRGLDAELQETDGNGMGGAHKADTTESHSRVLSDCPQLAARFRSPRPGSASSR